MEKKSSPAELSRTLRRVLGGITQSELATKLLLSRNYISHIEAGLKSPSSRVLAQMQVMLSEHNLSGGHREHAFPPSAVHEDQAPYGVPTPAHAATLSPPTSPRRTVDLAPQYRLPAETPTEKQCLEYMAAYLAAGREVPGAAAATWLELQEKFPLARWKKFAELHQ